MVNGTRLILTGVILVALMAVAFAMQGPGAAPCLLDVSGEDAETMTMPYSELTVELLGSEYTQTVDAYADLGEGEFLLWSDAGAHVGETYVTSVDAGTVLRLKAEGAFAVWSDDAGHQVEILVNGDSLPEFAPYLDQEALEDILGPYLVDGIIVLDPNQAIVIYEVGATDPERAAFDMQDLVLLVTVDCYTYCGDGEVQCPNDEEQCEECDDGNNEDGDGCTAKCMIEERDVTIIAHKIVCLYEEDLPNWGAGGPDITETTASDFIAQHPDCWLEEGWEFQWAQSDEENPGDNTGEAGEGWTTFGPTDENGMATVSVSEIAGDRLWVREVWKEGYLGFTYNENGKSNEDDVSAELYCYQDVLNYDNYDFIKPVELGGTYYCVAWNVPLEQGTYCGDGEVQWPNDEGQYEECDGEEGCIECRWEREEHSYCYLYFEYDEIENWGEGNAAEVAAVGPLPLFYYEGEWIPLDHIIDGGKVEDAPGLVVERGEEWFTVGLYGNRVDYERIWGSLYIVNGTVDSVSSLTGIEKLEKAFDGQITTQPGNDEVNYTPGENWVDFWLNIDTQHDVFIVNYTCCEEWVLLYDGEGWASYVVETNQGTQKNGQPVKPVRSDESAALGPAEGSGADYDPPAQTPEGTFYSLGFAGDIIVGFDGYIINGPGDDLQVFETTWSPGPYGEEIVDIYASQDGVNWVLLGTVARDGTVDLGELEWALYVKLVDASDPNDFPGSGDAYDVDAVRAFYLAEELEYICADDEEPEPYCGDGEVNQEWEECDDGNNESGDGCSAQCTVEDVSIVAHKIVCTYEEDLPNWGDGMHNITETTASDFIAQHPDCWLEEGWEFEWSDYNETGFPPDNSGDAGEGWTNFGPTDENGMASTFVPLDGITNIGVREIRKDGYIPFGLGQNDVSAEFYCHVDAYLYDNREVIGSLYEEQGLVDGMTYYCVAWNVPEEVEEEPYCGDGEVNQEWEECDDGNNESGDGCSAQCTVEGGPAGAGGSGNGPELPDIPEGRVLSITGGSGGSSPPVPPAPPQNPPGNGNEGGEGQEEGEGELEGQGGSNGTGSGSGSIQFVGKIDEALGGEQGDEPTVQPSAPTAFLLGGVLPWWAGILCLFLLAALLFLLRRRKQK